MRSSNCVCCLHQHVSLQQLLLLQSTYPLEPLEAHWSFGSPLLPHMISEVPHVLHSVNKLAIIPSFCWRNTGTTDRQPASYWQCSSKRAAPHSHRHNALQGHLLCSLRRLRPKVDHIFACVREQFLAKALEVTVNQSQHACKYNSTPSSGTQPTAPQVHQNCSAAVPDA